MSSRSSPVCNTDALGRALVKLLRHQAAKEGLAVRPDGYALLVNVMNVPSIAKHRPTLVAIETVVRSCPKQRLALREEDGALLIRANQGHTLRTLNDEELLTRITDPSVSNSMIGFLPFSLYCLNV